MSATAFDIKSASLDLLALLLRTDNPDTLATELERRFGKMAGSDSAEAFVLDLEALERPETLDLARVLPVLASKGIRAVALRHPDNAVASLARAHGLAYVPAGPATARNAPGSPQEAPPAEITTTIIDRPVRAGQQIYAKGGDLVVLAMVSAGAEVIADGNIHIYAPLRGRALAGARGKHDARIFVQAMEAELVSIAGVYRTIEQALPASIAGRPTQIYLEDERLVMQALGE